MDAHWILYVADQSAAENFYAAVLGRKPRLSVAGMTEFELATGAVLGLMPESGICQLLGSRLPDPRAARGIPRSELYLIVDEPEAYWQRALRAGATELSPLLARDWGHRVAYCLDLDAHVLAFATHVAAG